jgi:hypothetical protein
MVGRMGFVRCAGKPSGASRWLRSPAEPIGNIPRLHLTPNARQFNSTAAGKVKTPHSPGREDPPVIAVHAFVRSSCPKNDIGEGCSSKKSSQAVDMTACCQHALASVLPGGWAGAGSLCGSVRYRVHSGRDLLSVLDEVAKRGGWLPFPEGYMGGFHHRSWLAHGRLMLTVLGGLAEFERELIRARTGDGRKRAKDRGVRFGRPPKLAPHQRWDALARLAAGETQAVTQSGCPENDGYVQKIVLPSTVSFSFPVTGII